jgi:putative hydrolase of the HAD superfamily
MRNIKAIISDLGGVLLNLDFKKVSDSFKALGVHEFDDIYSQSAQYPVFEQLETGKISKADFCRALIEYSVTSLTHEQIAAAWNSILIDFRMHSLHALKNLRKKYKLYLLSNTNIIHQEAFYEIFKNTVGEDSFDALFDKAYYSHEIGLRKPDAEAYLYVLNENNLQAHETLFIDDTYKNIEGAKAVGLQTIFLRNGIKVEDLDL